MNHPYKYNFPSWNYGYTLGPPSASNSGNYTTFTDPSCTENAGNAVKKNIQIEDKGWTKEEEKDCDRKVVSTQVAVYSNSVSQAGKGETSCSDDSTKDVANSSEGKIGVPEPTSNVTSGEEVNKERSLQDILRGRNPIMYCNDQSKILKLSLDWEQTSESGPPHDKTFVWCCKMGDMVTTGTAGNKKGAKTNAAEEMVMKIGSLSKSDRKRSWSDVKECGVTSGDGQIITSEMFGQYSVTGSLPTQEDENQEAKRHKANSVKDYFKQYKESKANCGTAGLEGGFQNIGKAQNNPFAQNNPISKLYEHCKKIKASDPEFELILENILEQKRSPQGFTIKKTEYTMQCEVLGKQFQGKSLTKKEAKRLAAAAAWSDINGSKDISTGQNTVEKQPMTVGEMITQAKVQHLVQNN